MPNEDQQPEPVELPVEAPPEPPALPEPPEEPADTLSDPIEHEVPLDPHTPVRWIEQDGPPRERKLPAPGQIHVQWQMVILGSQGIIYEGDYDHVHRNIDSPAHVHNVGDSIEKILQGTLLDPLISDLKLYTVTRVGQMAAKAQPPAPAPALLTDTAMPQLPVAASSMPAMPPPPNPGAKI